MNEPPERPEDARGADVVGASAAPGDEPAGEARQTDHGSAMRRGEGAEAADQRAGGDVETFDVPDSSKVTPIIGSIERRQEWTRSILAILFVLLLGLIVVWSFSRTSSWAETKELLDVLLPAVTGLLGSAVGFYFATRR